jgi:hypothetical protein
MGFGWGGRGVGGDVKLRMFGHPKQS